MENLPKNFVPGSQFFSVFGITIVLLALIFLLSSCKSGISTKRGLRCGELKYSSYTIACSDSANRSGSRMLSQSISSGGSNNLVTFPATA